MKWNWNRIAALAVAMIYVIGGVISGGAEMAAKAGIFMIFPLACIWFGDALGGYIGPTGHGSITSSTPGIIVVIFGWLFLLLPLIIEVIASVSGSKS